MNISDAEARVMEVLWTRAPLSSRDVIESLSPVEGWSPKTVRTLLDRLHAKGAIERRRDERLFVYSPLLRREEWLKAQTSELVERHCQGRLAPLVSAFASSEALSETDRREILALLKGESS
jgi:BlaI family transcriptional regulator, penicillinase repressor